MDGSLKLSGDVGFDYVRCCANALVNLKFQLIHALQADTHQDNKSKFLIPLVEISFGFILIRTGSLINSNRALFQVVKFVRYSIR